MITETSNRGAGRSRVVILALGLVLTVVSVVSVGTVRADNLTDRLADSGADLVVRAKTAMQAGVERTVGLAALMAVSPDTSSAEFERYARLVGPGRHTVEVGFRSLEGSGALTHNYRDPLFDRDVLDHPQLQQAIAEFRITRLPKSLGLIDDYGVLIVGPVFATGSRVELTGIVYTVLDLSDLPASSLDERRVFSESSGEDIVRGDVAEPLSWVKIESVAGRHWTFVVTQDGPAEVDISLLLVALFGVVGSILASSRIAIRDEKLATEFALDALRRTTGDKDRFMASVSHELRTPLTSVVGLSSILETSWREMDEADVQKMIGDICHEGRELADLVEDLLTIGRVESGVLTYRPSVIDLDEEVGRVVERVLLPDHVRVEMAERLGGAVADALRTRQIVRNLLANAARHAQSLIAITAIHDNGHVGVRVSNDGPGIPADQVSRLFQAYQAGLRAGQPGSIGLGLYVSRQLARGMNGDLRYIANSDEVTFELTLPVSPSTTSSEAGTPAAEFVS